MVAFTKKQRKKLRKKVATHIKGKVSRHGHKIHKAVHVMSSLVASIEYVILFMGSLLGVVSLSGFAALWWATNDYLEYPLKHVSLIECRTQHWDTIEESCKIDLPRIHKANYAAYANNELYRQTYSVLWGAPYKWDSWDMAKGAHLWVDIPTSEGTPLYSVANGEVMFAGFQNGYGNVVKIRFTRGWVTYYSITAHMEKIHVRTGETVYTGQQIGTVGNTGSVFGALGGFHVHWEITADNFGRPKYGFLGCEDLTKGHVEIINTGLCREELHSYTYDPILFVESAYKKPTPVAVVDTPVEEDAPSLEVVVGDAIVVEAWEDAVDDGIPHEVVIHGTANDKEKEEKSDEVGHEIGDVVSSSHSHLISDVTINEDVTIVEFFAIPNYELPFDVQLFLEQYEIFGTYQYTSAMTSEFVMTVVNKTTGKPFHGILPASLQFVSENESVEITREIVSLVNNGKITNTFTVSSTEDEAKVALLIDLQRWAIIDLK